MSLSVYPGTYTLTHEQLETLLGDVLEDMQEQIWVRKLKPRELPAARATVVAEAMARLHWDATRPKETPYASHP